MKALCYHAPYDVRYDTVDEPQPQDRQDVVVKVDACSICGSDLHIFHGAAAAFTQGTGFCIGHEAIGEVVEVGSGVNLLKSGDKVMLPGAIGCGACARCLAGNVRNCLNGRQQVFGLGPALQGCQAELVRVPVGDFNLGVIPEGVSADQALMLTDAQATAWYGCRGAEIGPGDTVAVIGLGPIGLMAVESAFVLGASRVFAIDTIAERRDWAATLGAEALDPEAALALVEEATQGLMVDCVVEAVGHDATIQMALKLVRREGTVSVLGVNKNQAFPFPMGACLSRGITFRIGTTSPPQMWRELIPLVQQGRLRPEKFITTRVSLADGADAYRALDERRAGVLKTVIVP
jgi:2-desacetyl-2-hydroxyethyl bacteriochlorophyllide A dehydrogenase